MKLLKVVLKLMRFKPVISWTVCGFMLALSVAYYETGMILNRDLLIASFVSVFLLQGILSHAVNDLCDEEVDRDADVESTGRTKLLINGMATRYDLMALSSVVFIIMLLMTWWAYIRLGLPVVLFCFIGLYASIGYSVSPLKLGWRPFAEWTIVFPVIVTLVVAVYYMATEQISSLVFVIGAVHAMFNIRWFMDSRMVDIVSDRKHGKITTPISMENHNFKGDACDLYTLVMIIVFGCGMCSGYPILAIPIMFLFGYYYKYMVFSDYRSIESIRPRGFYVKARLEGIQLTIVNAVIISSYLLFQKVYIL